MKDDGRPIPQDRYLELLKHYEHAPGIRDGIIQEHRRRGGASHTRPVSKLEDTMRRAGIWGGR